MSPILLLIVVGALAYAAYWGYGLLTQPWSEPTQVPCVTQTDTSRLTADQVTVKVYNAGSVAGRAKAVSTQLKDRGFMIDHVGNIKEADIITTMVRGSSANDPEVKLVAAFFPGATIDTDGRADHTVDVILTDTFESVNMDAPTSISVPGKVVCLPATGAPQVGQTGVTIPKASRTTAPPATTTEAPPEEPGEEPSGTPPEETPPA